LIKYISKFKIKIMAINIISKDVPDVDMEKLYLTKEL